MIALGKRRVLILATVAVLAALSFMAENGSYYSLSSYSRSLRSLEGQRTESELPSYNSESIMKTAPNFPKFIPKLLVWDGKLFQVFGLKHRSTEYFETMKYSFRYVDLVPLLVHSLKTNFPDRFRPGTPPFELLFTDADSPHSNCVNAECPVEEFSPILLFGSVPKDPTVFPTMQSFPNPVFLHCLYEYQVNGKEDCEWPEKVNPDVKWNDLYESIPWRGADWAFMHYDDRFQVDGPFQVNQRLASGQWSGVEKQEIVNELLSDELVPHFGPRWRATLLSVRAEDDEVPWIDARFAGGENGNIHADLSNLGVRVSGYKIDPYEMSNYKYQIDLGGGGGTTWEGTLTKMLMPGVLLHHETPNKDWYYDLLEPWKHYIPVKWDLSDLRSAFNTAQKNQDKAKVVSEQARKLAEYMLSSKYLAKVYDELFVDYLGKVVDSYEPSELGGWPEMAKAYRQNGFDLFKVGRCHGNSCKLHCRQGEESNVLVFNNDAPKRKPSVSAGASGTRGAAQRSIVPHLDSESEVSREALEANSHQPAVSANHNEESFGSSEGGLHQNQLRNSPKDPLGSKSGYASNSDGNSGAGQQRDSSQSSPSFHEQGFDSESKWSFEKPQIFDSSQQRPSSHGSAQSASRHAADSESQNGNRVPRSFTESNQDSFYATGFAKNKGGSDNIQVRSNQDHATSDSEQIEPRKSPPIVHEGGHREESSYQQESWGSDSASHERPNSARDESSFRNRESNDQSQPSPRRQDGSESASIGRNSDLESSIDKTSSFSPLDRSDGFFDRRPDSRGDETPPSMRQSDRAQRSSDGREGSLDSDSSFSQDGKRENKLPSHQEDSLRSAPFSSKHERGDEDQSAGGWSRSSSFSHETETEKGSATQMEHPSHHASSGGEEQDSWGAADASLHQESEHQLREDSWGSPASYPQQSTRESHYAALGQQQGDGNVRQEKQDSNDRTYQHDSSANHGTPSFHEYGNAKQESRALGFGGEDIHQASSWSSSKHNDNEENSGNKGSSYHENGISEPGLHSVFEVESNKPRDSY